MALRNILTEGNAMLRKKSRPGIFTGAGILLYAQFQKVITRMTLSIARISSSTFSDTSPLTSISV